MPNFFSQKILIIGQLYCNKKIVLRVVNELWEAWWHFAAFWKLDRIDDLLRDILMLEIYLQVPGKKVRFSVNIFIQNFLGVYLEIKEFGGS